MKKKSFATLKDKKDWELFTKEMGTISSKESYVLRENVEKDKIKKLDLHGYSLMEANKVVKKFIIECFDNGYKKLLIVTGKGLRSKSHENPYISEKLSVLKYSVPEFIKNDENLNSKINKISKADQEDGGDGALYIFLKKNNKLRE